MGQDDLPRETAAEVATKQQKLEKIQDSLREGKIQATQEMIQESQKEFSTLHFTVEMKNRLAKLRDKNSNNDKDAFKNHTAIKYISSGENKDMYEIQVRQKNGTITKEKAYFNGDNNTFVKTENGLSNTAPKYIFGINNEKKLVALTQIPQSDILLFIEDGKIYKKEHNAHNEKNTEVREDTIITDSFSGEYTFKIKNKKMYYTVIKQPSINTNYQSASNFPNKQNTQNQLDTNPPVQNQNSLNHTHHTDTSLYTDESPYYDDTTKNNSSKISENINQLESLKKENIKKLDINKIQKLLDSVQTVNANKNTDIAQMLHFNLTEQNTKAFQETIQKIVGAPQNGYIGRQTLIKLLKFLKKETPEHIKLNTNTDSNSDEQREILSENFKNLTKGKIKSHQYEIEQLLKNKPKDTIQALAKILNVDLQKTNRVKFAKHIQKTIGLTGTGSTGIDGVIGNYTLKKIWERKLNETLDGNAETMRKNVLQAVNDFGENKNGDKERFIKELKYTARPVKENSQEAKDVLKHAQESKYGGEKRIGYLLNSLKNGGNALILDSRTRNLYLVQKNQDDTLQINLAIKTAVGRKGFLGIGEGKNEVDSLSQLKEKMNKKGVNKTPTGFHKFNQNNNRGFQKTGLDYIVDENQRRKGNQYYNKYFMGSIHTPKGKKASMITGALQIMGPIFLHGTDAWKNRITPTGKFASNGCVNISPADMALLMTKDLKSILIV